MAAILSATQTMQTPIIAGQDFTVTLAIKNSGDADVTISSIQPFVLTADNKPSGSALIGLPSFPPQATVTVAQGTTVQVNYSLVILSPSMSNIPAQPADVYQIGVTVQTSDGSVFGPQPAIVGAATNVNPPPNGQNFVQGTTYLAYSNVIFPGFLRFDQSLNSAALAAVF